MAIQSFTILLELLGGHAGVRGHDDLERWPCSPPASAPFTSPLSSEANGSLSFHSGMLRRERLHAVEREEELEIHRLLGPERAVVVEGGDALGERHEVRRAFRRDLRDEVDDGLLGRAVVPRGQRVRRRSARAVAAESQRAATRGSDEICRVDAWFCRMSCWADGHSGVNETGRTRRCDGCGPVVTQRFRQRSVTCCRLRLRAASSAPGRG